MGEVRSFTIHIYCDDVDCEFLSMGPVEDEPRLGIFRGKIVIDARQSAEAQGWERFVPDLRGKIKIEGLLPAWRCPDCVKRRAK